MEFNPHQHRIVETEGGAFAVEAGPGSGKTRVITGRMCSLIGKGVDPDRILMLTFTVAAADVMARRVKHATGRRPSWACNFHRACTRLLREFPEFGVREGFRILGKNESKRIVHRILEEIDPEADSRFLAGKVLEQVEQLRRSRTWCGEGRLTMEGGRFPIVLDAAERYEAHLAQENALDFDLIIFRVVWGLQDLPGLAREVRGKWDYIQVDEGQDTDDLQLELVKLLALESGNVMWVADRDQSIYGWRGAVYENTRRFIEHFRAELLPLTTNYRSKAEILEVAESVIECNSGRPLKKLQADRGWGGKVQAWELHTSKEEAGFVTEQIRELLAKGENPDEIAILYRIGALSRNMESACATAGVPTRMMGGIRFWDRKEILDMVAWAKVLLGRPDVEAYRRATKAPALGLGEASWAQIALADHPEEGIRRVANGGRGRARVRGFLEALEEARSLGSGRRALERLLDASGFLGLLQAESNGNREASLQRESNIWEALEVIDELGGVARFVDDLVLGLPVALDPEPKGAVTLSTVHGAKGMEWRHVFVIGMAEDVFPSRHAVQGGPEALAEERRLFYVAATRAMDSLTLTWPQLLQRDVQANLVRRSSFFEAMDWIPVRRPRERRPKVA